MERDDKNGISLFSQTESLLDSDPMEEIFALNLGDFISENLISKDLAEKIGKSENDKKEGLKKQLQELISIYSLKNTLCVLTFDPKEEQAIYTSIANSICQMVEVKNCSIYLSYEFSKNENTENDFILAGSTNEKAIKVFDVDSESIMVESLKTGQIVRKDGIISIPMHSNITIAGVIELELEGSVAKEYINLVQSIADLLGTTMALQKQIDEAEILLDDNNVFTSDLQHIRAELTALIADLCDYQQMFVENLAQSVDTKGHYTVSHSKNTAEVARKICRQLELNEKTTDLIYYAGLLQNIGKISVPEKLFAVNGKLSEEDLAKIKKQSDLGVQLLMNINFLSEVVPYITYKTERFDGKGLPEGLKGQSIPLGSRIIAVADAYCAMTSDRPYRKAMTKEEALKIMKEEIGTRWDGVVIQALENC
ncbi:HD domain-containing protein [bacterium]|nr:HD domain-containing protein [bacterium]